MTFDAALSSPVAGALVGGGIALGSTWLVEWARRKSEAVGYERQVAERHEREGRELIEHLLVLEQHLNDPATAGGALDEIELPDDLHSRMLVEIGGLHRDDCRKPLEEALYSITAIGIAGQFGTLDRPLARWQRRLSRCMLRIASAASRGDSPDDETLGVIAEASGAISEAWEQAEEMF
jgi:hypothetical protein